MRIILRMAPLSGHIAVMSHPVERRSGPRQTEPAAPFIVAPFLKLVHQISRLPAWLEGDLTDIALSHAVAQSFWAQLRKLSGDEDIGFAAGTKLVNPQVWSLIEQAPAGPAGDATRLAAMAPSIRASFDSYLEWVSGFPDLAYPWYREVGLDVWASVNYGAKARGAAGEQHDNVVLDRAEQDFRIAFSLALWRQMLQRPDLRLKAVHFAYPKPRSIQRHAELVDDPRQLVFGQPRWQICIAREIFDAPLPRANPAEFARLHANMCAFASARPQASVGTRTKMVLHALLAGGAASSYAVARRLGLSLRTLRRRLAEEGTTFQGVLDEVRQIEFRAHSEAELYPLKQTARLVGFANDGALRNAIRRWRSTHFV